MKYLLKSEGFTLIEILVALVILAVSLLALAGLMTTTTKNNSAGGRLTEAATLAQDKLEELRALPWEKIVSGSDSREIRQGFQYNRNWGVKTLKDNTNIKEVVIEISWTDVTSHALSFTSVISQ